jgi:hypothetical protein
MILARLLDSILNSYADAVNRSYASPPWDFGGRKREGDLEVARRILRAKFSANIAQGNTKVPWTYWSGRRRRHANGTAKSQSGTLVSVTGGVVRWVIRKAAPAL